MDSNNTDYVDLALSLNDYNFLVGLSANLIGFTLLITTSLVITFISRK